MAKIKLRDSSDPLPKKLNKLICDTCNKFGSCIRASISITIQDCDSWGPITKNKNERTYRHIMLPAAFVTTVRIDDADESERRNAERDRN